MFSLEELLSFHQKLYDLDLESEEKPKVPLSAHTSIHYFPKHNASFCLPPKSGSTSWLLSLESLADEYKNDPSSRARPKSDIYKRLPSLTKSELSKNFRGVEKSRKILNTRNPISKLFSAWKDKFRFQQEMAGKIIGTLDSKPVWSRYEPSRVRRTFH